MFSALGLFWGCASHSAVILLLLPADAIRIRGVYSIVNAFRYYYCTAALFENKAVFARFCVSGQEARSRRFWLRSAAGNFSAMWRSNRIVKIACLYEIDIPLLAANDVCMSQL